MTRVAEGAALRVGVLDRSQIDAAAKLLARAFAEEALFQYVLGPDARRREQALVPFMLGMIRGHWRFSELHGATLQGRLVGAGLRVLPGHFPVRGRDMFRLAASAVPGFARMCLTSPGAIRLIRAVGELEKHHPKGKPYWYLAFVGVHPDYRRCGVASELARIVLSRADQECVGCYLDTFGEGTMKLYQKLGFRIVIETHPFDDGPRGFGMWRDPVPGESAR